MANHTATNEARPRGRAGAPRGGREESNSLSFSVRLSLFGLFLSAFWTPLNTLLLPEMARPLAPEAFRGSAIGALTLIGVGIAVVAQPTLGALSDRSNSGNRRRLPMAAAALVAGPLVAAMWFAPSFWTLLLFYVALQCAMNAGQAAFQALIPDSVPEEKRARPSGVKSAFDVAGNAIGLGIAGGLIIAGAGEVAIMWTLVGLCVVGVAIAWMTTPTADRATQQGQAAGLFNIVGPFREASAEFRSAVAMRFLFLLGLYPVQRFILLMLEDRYEVEKPLARASVFILLCIGAAAVAGFVSGLLDDHLSARTLSRFAAIVASAALVGVAFSPNLAVLAGSGLVLAAAAGVFQAVNWGVLAKSLKDEEAARYFGLANIATAGASALAGGFGPLVDVAQRYVPGATYQVLFSICALIAVAALWPGRKLQAAPA